MRCLLRAHQYWRLKRLPVDLVILNDRAPSYLQDLQVLIETIVRTSQSMPRPEGAELQGRVFTLRADRATAAQRDVLRGVARGGALESPGNARRAGGASVPSGIHCGDPSTVDFRPRAVGAEQAGAPDMSGPPAGLELFNGLGGFDAAAREYVIVLRAGQWTPAPWINVIANANFGCLVSEAGAGWHLVGEQPGEPADAVVQ